MKIQFNRISIQKEVYCHHFCSKPRLPTTWTLWFIKNFKPCDVCENLKPIIYFMITFNDMLPIFWFIYYVPFLQPNTLNRFGNALHIRNSWRFCVHLWLGNPLFLRVLEIWCYNSSDFCMIHFTHKNKVYVWHSFSDSKDDGIKNANINRFAWTFFYIYICG